MAATNATLTKSQAHELLHGMASRGQQPGGYVTLGELLDGWARFGRQLLADWPGRRPPIVPTYTPTELLWRRENAARLGFPADGSPDPPDPHELDQRPFGQQVADFLRSQPHRRADLAAAWEGAGDSGGYARRLKIWRIVFGGD